MNLGAALPPTPPAPPVSLYATLKSFSLLIAYGAILIGLAVLVGWSHNIPALKSLLPNVIALNPLTALGVLACGFSLIFLQRENSTDGLAGQIGRGVALAVMSIGLVRVAGYLFQLETGIDQIFFAARLDGNHMAPNTAANFLALGAALYLTDSETHSKWQMGQIFSLFVFVSAMLAFLGYAYGVNSFYEVSTRVPMALNSTILFIFLSLASLCLRPGAGMMKLLTSDNLGGTLGRRLLPACVFAPALIGMLAQTAERAGFFDKEFRLAVVVISNSVVFTALVWWLANVLFKIDVERKEAADMVQRLSVTDELTSLYNRRGFKTLTEQQLRISRRDASGLMVLFADLDGLKKINDTHGHKAGDQAIMRTAEILRKSFRESDILARFAGDEFAVLALGADPEKGKVFLLRVQQEFEAFNQTHALPFPLLLSVGASYFTGQTTTIDQLMSEADKKLYEIKRDRRPGTAPAAASAPAASPASGPGSNPAAGPSPRPR